MKPTVAARRYTLEEIDRMRSALYSADADNRYWPYHYEPGIMYLGQNWKLEAEQQRLRVEEELRTCMMGGVGLEEVEAKREKAKTAKEERVAQFEKEAAERLLAKEYGPR